MHLVLLDQTRRTGYPTLRGWSNCQSVILYIVASGYNVQKLNIVIFLVQLIIYRSEKSSPDNYTDNARIFSFSPTIKQTIQYMFFFVLDSTLQVIDHGSMPTLFRHLQRRLALIIL